MKDQAIPRLKLGMGPFVTTDFIGIGKPIGNFHGIELLKPDTLAAGGTVQRPKKILVVDDYELLRETSSLIMCKLGYDCKTAVNGREAISMLKEESFDLVVSDRDMPVMDGSQMLAAIRRGEAGEQNRDLKIIFVTGKKTLYSGELLALGANGVMDKPVDPDTINRVIAGLLKEPEEKQ